MVAMDVQLDEASTKFLLQEAKRIPKEVRRAFYFACGIALRNMRLRMSGKSDKIERWQGVTREYRYYQSRFWPAAEKFGGKLMWPTSKVLTMQPEGDRVRIGWIGNLEDAAKKFQEGGSEPTTPEWRHRLYRAGISRDIVPKVAETPPRPVVEQVTEEAGRHLADWTIGALSRVLKGEIPKWEVRYQKSAWTKQGVKAAEHLANVQEASVRLTAYQRWVAETKGMI